MVRRALAAIAIGCSLWLAAPAGASYTIGAPTTPTTGSAVGSLPAGVTHYATGADLNSPAPSAGIVVHFEARWSGTTSGPYTYRVLRPTGGSMQAVSSAASVRPPANSVAGTDARLPIQAGDTIGIDHPDGSFIKFRTHTGPSINYLTPPPADGDSGTPVSVQPSTELLLNATVEADADGDGYGDETQDFCPSDGSRHTPCPVTAAPLLPTVQKVPVAVARLASGSFRASSKGTVALRVSCPSGAATACSGTLGLEVRGVTLARASRAARFSVPAGATSTVSVSLSKRGRKLLDKKRKLKARAIVTSGGTSLTATVTLKAAKKKKRPKKTTGR